MIYVDASAIVAIVTQEPDAERLLDALQRSEAAITSPAAVFEATLGILRKRRRDVAAALEQVQLLLDGAGITVVPISADDGVAALDAFARYGKGQGHPAQLNMGDCFAYAVAAGRGAAMLYTGNDFAHTDIRPAGPPA